MIKRRFDKIYLFLPMEKSKVPVEKTEMISWCCYRFQQINEKIKIMWDVEMIVSVDICWKIKRTEKSSKKRRKSESKIKISTAEGTHGFHTKKFSKQAYLICFLNIGLWENQVVLSRFSTGVKNVVENWYLSVKIYW